MSSTSDSSKISVELEGRDRLEFANGKFSFRGCSELTNLMLEMKAQYGKDVKQWPAPEGVSHSEILLREFILKLNGQWNFPYKEAEVCHCRNVSCRAVDQAIVAGAHSTAIVSRQTSASTACGTCRPDVQKIIDYRLKSPAHEAVKKSA